MGFLEPDRGVGVIMGDIIASERSADVGDLHAAFNRAITDHNICHADKLVSPLTVTLGDEFQGLTCRLTDAARICRSMRLNLLAAEVSCRFVIGHAIILTPINHDRAWNMMGPGLAEARNQLNQKSRVSALTFSLANSGLAQQASVITPLLNGIGAGITAIEEHWTPKQIGLAVRLEAGATIEQVAAERGTSIAAVYKMRRTANYDAWTNQWDAITGALQQLDAMFA